MHNKTSIQRLFRIQGGIFPNRSRNYIRTINDKIICSKSKALHIGDMDHMLHFLFKRLGIDDIKNIPKDVSNYDLHIIEMYVPYWLPYLIEKYSVNEFRNRNITYPKLVDKETPRAVLSIIWKLE